MSEHKKTEGEVPTTGHLWDDDLADYINEPPKWWMLGLLASGLWIVIYWLMYPAVPNAMAGTYFKGLGLPGLNLHLAGTDASQDGKWTAIKELAIDQKELDDVRKPYEDKLKAMTPAAILADTDLSEYVARSGKVLFADNCAACHGQNGIGTIQAGNFAQREKGLMAPMLRDDDWLYGGEINTIHETIVGGRQALMSPHKDTLSTQQIDDVAHYVMAMSAEGKEAADKDASVAAGMKVFAESDCTACHGPDAKGQAAMGSANLTDKIWRFDGSLAGITQTITYGVNAGDNARVAIMPNFTAAGKLSPTEIKKLAVYVYKFGGGKPDAVAIAPATDAAASAVPSSN
jgi:cytochrome c oxidase cbb3-type subunit III